MTARNSGRRVLPSIKRRIRMCEPGYWLLPENCLEPHTRSRLALVCRRPEAIFFAFFEKSFAADAEYFGGAPHAITHGFQRGGDDFAFHFFERTQAGDSARGANRGSAQNIREIFRL